MGKWSDPPRIFGPSYFSFPIEHEVSTTRMAADLHVNG